MVAEGWEPLLAATTYRTWLAGWATGAAQRGLARASETITVEVEVDGG